MAFNLFVLQPFSITLFCTLVFCLTNVSYSSQFGVVFADYQNKWMMHGRDAESKFREWCYYQIVADYVLECHFYIYILCTH
jgi:hypothetical protein